MGGGVTWHQASDRLPATGETVLLHLSAFARPRPRLATIVRGDPNAEGEAYRRDRWVVDGLAWQYVEPDHVWAPIPTPPGVAEWARPYGAVTVEEAPEPDEEQAPLEEAPLFAGASP